MREFFAATLSFPTVLFSFALIVVVAFWLAVLIGGAEAELFESGPDAEVPAVHERWGLGGVPATLTLSVLIALAWFLCLAGSALTAMLHLGGVIGVLSGVGVLIGAVVAAVAATRAVVIPLRRVFAPADPITRDSLVGRVCVIRTGRVGPDFGQAELVSADGSSAIVQVRQTVQQAMETPLTHDVSAIVYDYDPATETFWVAAVEGI
ncbi:hypothetical protein [Nocardia crassostreae]|uniref:hypothetical protein n=1 Tax=Nocardia crassostreae TaxID=53428 RepID=UPI00083002F2|nr:hypothetical protein [Nocardia crassostreae]